MQLLYRFQVMNAWSLRILLHDYLKFYYMITLKEMACFTVLKDTIQHVFTEMSNYISGTMLDSGDTEYLLHLDGVLVLPFQHL